MAIASHCRSLHGHEYGKEAWPRTHAWSGPSLPRSCPASACGARTSGIMHACMQRAHACVQLWHRAHARWSGVAASAAAPLTFLPTSRVSSTRRSVRASVLSMSSMSLRPFVMSCCTDMPAAQVRARKRAHLRMHSSAGRLPTLRSCLGCVSLAPVRCSPF